MIGRNSGGGHMADGLMPVWIKQLAERIDTLNPVAAQCFQKCAARGFDIADEAFHGAVVTGRRMLKGQIQMIGQRHHIDQHAPPELGRFVRKTLLPTLAQIVDLSLQTGLLLLPFLTTAFV
jgi:hypothetical protein